eukprot:Skav201234  [mRNA]  locus=scaffold4162:233341:238470:+ [translate_table: standard]
MTLNTVLLSFNVRTLQDPGSLPCVLPNRMWLLEGQAIELGVGILGLQETRAGTSQTASTQHYYKYRAAAEKGQGGTELWFSTSTPLGRCGSHSCFFDPNQAVVLEASAELLLVRWHPRGQRALLFVAGHAPHKGHPDDVKTAWWSTLSSIIARHSNNADVIMFLDANAALGDVQCDQVGNLDPETEETNGAMLRELAEKHALWIPSTFSDIHCGPSATWFSSATTKPAGSRLDYILLPLHWRGAKITSMTLPDMDAGQSSLDHVAVAIFITQHAEARPARRALPHSQKHVDWRAVRQCRDRHIWNQIFSDLPQPSWETDVHEHWHQCHGALTTRLATLFPRQRSVPRKPYIDATTWALRNRKQALRRQAALRSHLCKHLDEAACWQVWNGRQNLHKAFLNGFLWALRCQAAHRRDRDSLRQAQVDLKEALRSRRTDFLSALAQEAEAAPNDQIYFKLQRAGLRSTRRIRDRPLPLLDNGDGNVAMTPAELRECWRQHFARIECGRKVRPEELHQLCIYTELVNYKTPDENFLRSLPSLRDLESSFRRCKANRASGPDQIPPELCHYAARWMTHYLAPLFLKCSLYCAEPIQWKGGVLHEVWKRKGSTKSADSYRGILVSSHLAKCFHNTFRAPTLQWHAATADDLQFGGLPKRGVDFASHSLRAFLSVTRQNGSSSGVFFIDIKSAYYRLLRSLAVGPTCTQRELLEVFRAMDLPADLLYELATAAFSPSALEETGCPSWLVAFGKMFHQHTWFHTRNGEDVTETRCGTRPGDGYADLLFNLVIGRTLRTLEQELVEQGLQTSITWNGFCDHRALPGDEHVAPGLAVTWADDIAVMVHHDQACHLLEALELVFQTYVDRLASHGLLLNYGAGKTEALVLFRGKGAQAIRQQVFGQEGSSITIQTQSHGELAIRLVACYKHLGVQIHASGFLLPELRVRVGHANTAFNRHRRSVYQNTDLSVAKRMQIFRACVLSILFWNGGTWPPLRAKELRYLNGAFRRLLQRLLHRDFPPEELHTWSDVRLFGFIGILPVADQLRVQRLSYYGRLVVDGPPVLWALLANDQKWLRMIPEDLDWLYSNAQSAVFRPSPAVPDGFLFWHTMMRDKVRCWKGLLRKAQAHARLQLCIQSEVDTFHRDFARELEAHHPSLVPTPLLEIVEDATLFPCIPCGRVFDTKQGWAIHAFKAHGRKAPARYLADQQTCAHCMKAFLNPSRLYLHLRNSKDCFNALRGRGVFVEPLPGRGSRDWNCSEQFTFLPPQQAAGPHGYAPHTPAGLDIAVSPHETDLLTALMDLEADPSCGFLADGDGSATIEAIRHCLCLWPASLDEMKSVLNLWRTILIEEQVPRRRLLPATTAFWCRSIDAVLHCIGYRWLCPDLLCAEPLHRRALPAAERLRHIPPAALAALAAPPKVLATGRPIFVHFFSGRRRDQDFQSFMDGMNWGDLPVPLVISLDIVVDKVNGNCMDPAVRKFWLNAMKSGMIAGMLAGPPCESWSVSRERWRWEHTGPRPLRSSGTPWALLSLLLREARQVYTANSLLMFSVASYLILWMLGRFAMLEHPAPPDQEQFPEAPSIWRLSPLVLLAALPGSHRHHIYQGYHGARSPKPTCLLTAHGPNIESFSRPFRTRETLPPPLQMGKVANRPGEYATAALKEYPPSMNEFISHSFRWWLQRANVSPPSSQVPIPPDVMAIFNQLHVTDFTSHYGPDFAFN